MKNQLKLKVLFGDIAAVLVVLRGENWRKKKLRRHHPFHILGSQSSTGVHAKDVEERLYQMLPLFCKVFGTAPADDMTEKFGDILQVSSS